MSFSERQQHFKAWIAGHPKIGPNARIAENFGFSNSARVIDSGLFACTNNLQSYSAKIVADPSQGVSQFVFLCVLTFPPNDEVYFAIVVNDAAAVNGGLIKLAREVEARNQQLQAEGKKAGSINNNVKFYVTDSGKLFFHNDDFMASLGEGVTLDSDCLAGIDGVLFSIWPPSVSARRSLLAREFVGYLGSLIGSQRVHEVNVWPDESSVDEAMRRMPATIPLADIEAAVTKLGGYYPGGEVRRFHAAMNFLPHKHFVILSGLSGTGKTQLALKYARAVHGVKTNHGPDPLLFVCPVRPEWTDPTGLTGYYDVLSGQYVVPPFLEAVLVATAQRDSPVFVVLDEMNLARVEYYFSDVLSCVETGSPLQLHSNSVPLEGSTGGTIRAELPLPHNLYIVGTINVDETTNPVSDKILDRASVIEMTDVNLAGFLDDLGTRKPELKAACEACRDELAGVHGLMTGHNLGFGYRVAEEFVRYHDFATAKLAGDPVLVIDDLMVQKVLVKLRGGEGQRALLTGLASRFAGRPRSRAFIERLTADLDEFGSFQAAR
ncbi:MAG: hypothetical protein V2I24_10045 [Halieaceae bacterium]|jgi:hypothetical protein|nr:hypothetical protein [Halieaceae bacterium]